MASAVAVAADIERPNLPNNLDDDAPITGAIVSADNGDDDEDVVRGARKKTNVDRDLFDDNDDEMPAEENEEDLFGEDDAEEQRKYVHSRHLTLLTSNTTNLFPLGHPVN